MILDIVEGATDKSDQGLRAILSSQAKLRIFIAAPVVIVEALLYLMSPEGVAGRLLALTGGYCAYVAIIHVLVRYRRSVPAQQLLLATAVLDPLALSAWLVVIGEYGSIMVGFYLFTILGFGFRTGRPLMHLCQLTAVASFALVFLSVPYWQQNPTLWVALMLPLLAVPMYAGVLIRTLRESRELAERESQAKTELLAKVSHELRTPLTGIISATELLAAEVGYEAVARRTDTILTLSNELLREINELLDVAKFGARAAQLQPAPFDLGGKVGLVGDALGVTAQNKGLEFRVTVDPSITDWVVTDAHYLGRVLLNLASNAVKFTERGHVHVDVELLEDAGSAYRLRFCIEDSGIGIPESFHGAIFQPFAQVEQGASRRFGGTGLGLAFARQIVELMGGTLRFESTPGVGSRFWFDVALERSPVPQALPASDDAARQAGWIPPLRILVAEDNETNLMLLRELLQNDGHEVTTSACGMEALEILVDNDFDLLLLDYNLGDMDGVRLLQTYRFGRAHPAPALFLTADTTQQTATRLRESGGIGVMYKPITLARLRMALRDLCASGDGHPHVCDPVPVAEAVARPPRPVLTAVVVSPLDPAAMAELKSVSVRPEFFPNLLIEASNDIQRNVQLIIAALADREYGQVREAAHALKGVSGDVGAVRLLALAGNLMTIAREDLDGSRERLSADLADAMRITLAALSREVRQAPDRASADGAAPLHLE